MLGSREVLSFGSGSVGVFLSADCFEQRGEREVIGNFRLLRRQLVVLGRRRIF